MTDLGTLGGRASYANGINNRGEIVGEAQARTLEWHGFVWNGNRMKDLAKGSAAAINDQGWIGGNAGKNRHPVLWKRAAVVRLDRSSANDLAMPAAINASGLVVGAADLRAVVWHDRTIRALSVPPGALASRARAVNDRGQVVGELDCPAVGPHSQNAHGLVGWLAPQGCLWDAGGRERLGPLTDAVAINNRVQVAGACVVPTGAGESVSRAVLWDRGRVLELGALPGVRETFPHGINRSGHVVGSSSPRTGAYRAFLWENGRMEDLNRLILQPSGWVLEVATAINDRDPIVGYGIHNGRERAFLLSPLPART